MLRTFRVHIPYKLSKIYKYKYWWFGFWQEFYDCRHSFLGGVDIPRRCCNIDLGYIHIRVSWDVGVFWR